MPISVICPGCHTRFKVSDKFAGQKGGCPKCKAVILVPKLEDEIVIHEPDHSEFGARNAQGVSTLKPLARVDAGISPIALVVLGGTIAVAFLVALVIRFSGSEPSYWLLGIGALAVAPPVCWAGYLFLRDDEELEGFAAKELAIRTGLCSLGYALLWGAFALVYGRVVGSEPFQVWHALYFGPPFLFAGAGLAFSCYDLDLGTGFFHFAFYLVLTILLRLAMGLPAVGPLAA